MAFPRRTINPSRVGYQPILDVARGQAAGYHASVLDGGWARSGAPTVEEVAGLAKAALTAYATLPVNTFISIPVPQAMIGAPKVQDVLAEHGDLSGVVLDVTHFSSSVGPETERALATCRHAGAKIALGGRDDAQPELGSIVRLRPAIIRLGHAWINGLDTSPARRSAIEVTGQLAAQLDAWILADAVCTAAELRALSELGVPLAQGPFIGEPQTVWPDVNGTARSALPRVNAESDGVLRELVQQAYTTDNASAARAVLPDASGYDVVVVLDDRSRPVSLLQQRTFGRWEPTETLRVNVDTAVTDVVSRAMARPRTTRFLPVVCTDNAGRFVGILRIEQLMAHLAATAGT